MNVCTAWTIDWVWVHSFRKETSRSSLFPGSIAFMAGGSFSSSFSSSSSSSTTTSLLPTTASSFLTTFSLLAVGAGALGGGLHAANLLTSCFSELGWLATAGGNWAREWSESVVPPLRENEHWLASVWNLLFFVFSHLPKEARDPRSIFSIDSSKEPVSQSKSLWGKKSLIHHHLAKRRIVTLKKSFLQNPGFLPSSIIPFCNSILWKPSWISNLGEGKFKSKLWKVFWEAQKAKNWIMFIRVCTDESTASDIYRMPISEEFRKWGIEWTTKKLLKF